MPVPINLQRFLDAQETAYPAARAELLTGHKRTHWIWYIFPQLVGLGQSQTSQFYAICSLEEAEAYLRHPVLGPRLEELTRIVLRHAGRTARDIFGSPDDLKFYSCLTLFGRVEGAGPVFREALEVFFNGREDGLTLELLQAG